MSNKTDNKIRQVVIYCASSPQLNAAYFSVAERLGELLAKNNIASITGAGMQGLMGAINNSVLRYGGTAKGVIPQFMVDSGWCHNSLSELLITETMHDRKAKMAEMSDAAIALPGGMGTLEELAEILTWKQLGLYKKPLIILNINNYYTPLLEFFERMISEKFMHERYRRLWHICTSPEEVIDALQNLSPLEELPSKY